MKTGHQQHDAQKTRHMEVARCKDTNWRKQKPAEQSIQHMNNAIAVGSVAIPQQGGHEARADRGKQRLLKTCRER